jgi:hypothetical protein
MSLEQTDLLDKSETKIDKTNIFTTDKNQPKTKSDKRKRRNITVKKFCANYKYKYNYNKTKNNKNKTKNENDKTKNKHNKNKNNKTKNENDDFGRQNKALYNACRINQYCRKNKCKDIDRKFDKIKNNKLGINGNTLLMTSITSKCPIEMSNKSRKKCLNRATKRFYEDNNMGDIYNQVLECDQKICAKERQIFLNNLFRANKTKKRIRQPIQVSLENIPDQQMIETN